MKKKKGVGCFLKRRRRRRIKGLREWTKEERAEKAVDWDLKEKEPKNKL